MCSCAHWYTWDTFQLGIRAESNIFFLFDYNSSETLVEMPLLEVLERNKIWYTQGDSRVDDFPSDRSHAEKSEYAMYARPCVCVIERSRSVPQMPHGCPTQV